MSSEDKASVIKYILWVILALGGLFILKGCSSPSDVRAEGVRTLEGIHSMPASQLNITCKPDGRKKIECYGTPRRGGQTVEVDCRPGLFGPWCELDR